MENSGNRTLKYIFDVSRSTWCSKTLLVFLKRFAIGSRVISLLIINVTLSLKVISLKDHVFFTNLLVVGQSVMV